MRVTIGLARSVVLLLCCALLLVGVPGPATAVDTRADRTRPTMGWSVRTVDVLPVVERKVGMLPAAVSTYADFTDPFPREWARAARDRSVPLLLAWEPWDHELGYADQPGYSFAAITAGHHDEYAREFARDVKAADVTVMIRFAPEMNGDWQVWHKSETPDGYAAAWRHLHDLFTAEGVTNVRWVWNPNVDFEGAVPFEEYWPGAQYVDWVALDGYNWENVLPNRVYEDAYSVFAPSVERLRVLAPGKPLMLAEVGSGPASKRRWLTTLLDAAPRLGARLVVWFEHDKETDWRLSSSRFADDVPTMLRKAGWRVRPLS